MADETMQFESGDGIRIWYGDHEWSSPLEQRWAKDHPFSTNLRENY